MSSFLTDSQFKQTFLSILLQFQWLSLDISNISCILFNDVSLIHVKLPRVRQFLSNH